MKPFVIAAALIGAVTIPAQAGIQVQAWGGVRDKGVDLYILTNAQGMEARITNYGAAITAIRVPGRDGNKANVVQGFDSLADYTSPDYKGRYGAVIGRFANRIKDDSFQLHGVSYRISRDPYTLKETENRPYDERVWTAQAQDGNEPQLTLSLTDRNGSMGYSVTLKVQVTYTVTRNNVLRIAYHARSDKDTIFNITNHAYFNLAGEGSVLDQLLTVNADSITAVDEKNVPTGEIRPVAGTAFDFRAPTPIGTHINDPDPLLQRAGGFDHNFALNGKPGRLHLAARLEDRKSGRVLEEWTTQPGLQVYTANYAPPPVGLAKGYGVHSAVALEAQGFPNAPNIASFPSTLLRADGTYDEVTEYRFKVAP